ncbi:homocysteine S-methyltransferase family protein [Jutongia hominis]|uniref:Methionine synthase n=1 Tax=Jutongia hominis TaxID=2763664 RepID=A0ABR7MXY6_9FIRM|nr:homocysteine S-methyltransferase family protein [Jutongia hominis]MBC8558097.1 homocysteine S-methyltransferase family protein [Jutongia hominis]
MTKKEFLDLVNIHKVILDGATGSNLQKRGMPTGVCPEEWILENADVMCGLQREYIQAGTNVLYAPTFSGNRIKLEEYGLADKLEQMNTDLVAISKRAIQEEHAEGKVFIAGDITMTGVQVEPLGPMPFEELVSVYKEQITCLDKAGVDLLVVETMMSLQECRAAVIAAKEVTTLPIMVTLSFNEDGRTLFGTNPETAALVLTTLSADAIGINCSTGPEKMIPVIEKMSKYTDIPLICKPNAGLPQMVDGETVYDMDADTFAKEMLVLAQKGVDILGGCCGTTPEHIQKMVSALKEENLYDKTAYPERIGKAVRRAVSSERATKDIDLDGAFGIIGERINPTGKKALQAELREGCLDIVTDMAEAQEAAGASILDVNMGMNGIDEKEMMLKAVKELSVITDLPLSIDSSHVDVVEAALRIYPGRALINSISLEPEKFEKLIPIAKKYGAMFILLPLSEKGLPKDIQEKKEIIHIILDAAKKQGLCKEDVIVDGLVATVGANRLAAIETLETISYCKNELGVATACGLSNISFGLPERIFVNSAFMAMAIQNGLTMAIANPSQELLMHAVYAADLLCNKPDSDLRYIERVSQNKISVVDGEVDADVAKKAVKKTDTGVVDTEGKDALFTAVVKGRKEKVLELVKEKIANGEDAQGVIDQSLIPAINHVGELFDKQIYYLPQLISSAEAMEGGIDLLEPELAKNRSAKSLGTVVIATVEHDIHDIGKNLVALMLRNYGYKVIDLGKDVPADVIIDTAIKEDADIIGLSALMTTTMMEMKKVVNMKKEQNVRAKVIIGGAVITQGFADEIGADGYSKDAQDAVEVVGRLLAD